MLISLFAAAAFATALPDISNLTSVRRKPTMTYLDRSGAVLGVRGGQYSAPVQVDRLPRYVPGAFVAIEDRRFYEHPGIDAIGIARALAADLAKGRIVEGASTITQQLARNLFLSPDQTMERKAQEMVLAVMLERRYSKNEILGLYLSRVYFGSGAYGLEAASRRFFDKPAARLSVAEAAMLAGTLKSPTNYNPIEQPERAEERARLVVDAMKDTGVITSAQRRSALTHPAHARAAGVDLAAQYFVDWADAQVRQIVGAPVQDLTVQTTLDLKLEAMASAAVQTALMAGRGKDLEEAALVSLGDDGRIEALIGGADYGRSQFDRAVAARRQAGSAWKPFVYLTALEVGRTPETPVVDEPVTIGTWSPRNYEAGYLGPITLQTALARSVNTVAARLADEIGRDAVARTAKRLGISSPINGDPAMALGTTPVTPLEMATAYSPFADAGRRAEPYGVQSIRLASGRLVYQHRPAPAQEVIRNPALSEMNQMLRAVITGGTGVRAAVPGYDLAGKTGTTSDYRDAWFCGFTGGVTTVVWLGRDDDRSMPGVTGGSYPAQIWRSYMAAALPRLRPPAIPLGAPPPPSPLSPSAPARAAPGADEPPPALSPPDPVDELLNRRAPTR